MSPTENASIAQLTREVHGYREELLEFKSQVKPALDFYDNIIDAAKLIKWSVAVGAGVATIAATLRVLGII